VLGQRHQGSVGGQLIACGQLLDQPRVLAGPFLDPLLEQRQAQIRLALELRVHDPLRKASLLSDLVK
jgi:hypothetical protein